jgi:hypothetical protein
VPLRLDCSGPPFGDPQTVVIARCIRRDADRCASRCIVTVETSGLLMAH